MAEVKSDSKPQENGNASDSEEKESNGTNFECNICLDSAKDAVISMCGHLFCWACLHRWLETRASNQTCPVCKAAISKDKVIPLYGRGSTNQQDPREKAVPPRPQGQRTEAEPQQSFMPGFNFGEGEGIQFHFGIGAFPFGFFNSFNNIGFGGNAGNIPPGRLTQQECDERFLSQIFFLMAILFLMWLIFV